MDELTTEQKDKIKDLISEFIKFLLTGRAQAWIKERNYRTRKYKEFLSKENISYLNEQQFTEIIKTLYVFDWWTNKDYIINNLIRDNGFENIKKQLYDLLYVEDTSFDKRFDKFLNEIKGIGVSGITEILAFVDSDKYAIWNNKPKRVLPFLGINQLDEKFYKYPINGKQYLKCLEVFDLIRKSLTGQNFAPDADYLYVDLFIAFIFYEILPKQKKEPIEKEIQKSNSISTIKEELKTKKELIVVELDEGADEDEIYEKIIMNMDTLQRKRFHDRVCEMLAIVGQWMGYEPEERYKIMEDSPYEIDVVWLNKGIPNIAIEVHDGGNPTEAKDRLNHAKDFNFRKVIIVSKKCNEDRLKKILKYDKLSNWVEIWSIKSIFDMYQYGENFFEFYKKFEDSRYKDFKDLEFI